MSVLYCFFRFYLNRMFSIPNRCIGLSECRAVQSNYGGMLVNSFGSTCGVVALCVLLLAVDTGAEEGSCVCRVNYRSNTVKPTDPILLAQWEAITVNFCEEPLIDTCQDNCECFCPVAGIRTDQVAPNGSPVVVCTDGSDGEARCVGEKDRLENRVFIRKRAVQHPC